MVDIISGEKERKELLKNMENALFSMDELIKELEKLGLKGLSFDESAQAYKDLSPQEFVSLSKAFNNVSEAFSFADPQDYLSGLVEQQQNSGPN